MMPTLTLLVGLPGSGKSTSIPKDSDGFVYSTDEYLEAYAEREGITYNEAWKQQYKAAVKYMNSQLAVAIQQGRDVIWDQTNLIVGARKRAFIMVPSHYRKVCVCRVPPRDALEWAELDRRILSREGKTIPRHIIESMADSYVEPTLDEGFDEVYLIDMYGYEIR
jgi:predicted kinase